MSRILAIEIGNSSVACAFFENQKIVESRYIESSTHYTAQQYSSMFSEMLPTAKYDTTTTTAIFVASVVPALTDTIVQAAKQLVTKCEPLVINGHSLLNIAIRTENKR